MILQCVFIDQEGEALRKLCWNLRKWASMVGNEDHFRIVDLRCDEAVTRWITPGAVYSGMPGTWAWSSKFRNCQSGHPICWLRDGHAGPCCERVEIEFDL